MKKLQFIPLLVLALIGFVTSCDLPDTEIHIASGGFMTHVTQVVFTDDPTNANRSLTNIDGTVITISGPDADKVYDSKGEKDFVISGGSLILLLDPNIEFTEKDTYSVVLNVNAAGYESTTIPVTFQKDINDGFVLAVLLDTNNLPSAIVKTEKTQGTIDAATGLSEEVQVTADNSQQKGTTTKVTVPAGTKMKDNQGNVVTGALKAEILSFSEGGNGMAFVPGGLSHSNIIIDDKGTKTDGEFIPAGLVSVHMTANGKRITTFEGQKVNIDIYLSEGSINPKNKEPYKEGDEIHIWSLSEGDGQWRYEKQGVVSKDTNGKLYVSHATTHLSWFSFGWFFAPSPVCKFDSLNVNWSNLKDDESVKVRVTMTKRGEAWSTWYGYNLLTFDTEISKSKNIKLSKVIDGTPYGGVQFQVFDLDHDNKLIFSNVEGSVWGNCGPAATINITEPNPIKTKVTLTFKGLCGSTQVFPPPGTRVFYKENTETEWKNFYYVTIDNKSNSTIITDKVQAGKTYNFKIISAGKEGLKSLKVESGINNINVDIPDDICKALTK